MKSFDKWNQLKKNLNQFKSEFYVNQREIRYVHLGANIGFEQDGKSDKFIRPVLVLKKLGNVFVVIPMTTNGKDTVFYYSLPDYYFEKSSSLILSQIRVIDKARFIEKMKMIGWKEFREIKKKLKALIL